jgi:hypothetical protein
MLLPQLSFVLFAQQLSVAEPRFLHAQPQSHQVAAALEQEFRTLVQSQDRPAWIAYAVPRTPRSGDSCFYGNEAIPNRAVMLEGSRHEVVLFRVERRKVVRIRSYAIDCEMDAGDLPVHWLTAVRPDESLRLLDSFTHPPVDLNIRSREAREAEQLATAAVYAMGSHDDPRTFDALVVKARTEKSRPIRRAAVSAIGRLKDPRAFSFLEEVLRK